MYPSSSTEIRMMYPMMVLRDGGDVVGHSDFVVPQVERRITILEGSLTAAEYIFD
jgi:hypothetical protein